MTISIVVPVHNEERTLGPCLYSLQNQGVDEIIVVLDRCTDRSRQITKYYPVQVTSINKHHYRRNWLAETVNHGITRIKGEIIGIVEADTFLTRGYVHKIVKQLNGKVVSASGILTSAYPADNVRGTGRFFQRMVLEDFQLLHDVNGCDTYFDLLAESKGFQCKVVPDAIMYDMRQYNLRKLIQRGIRRGKARRELGQSLPYMTLHMLKMSFRYPIRLFEAAGNLAGYISTETVKDPTLMRRYEANQLRRMF